MNCKECQRVLEEYLDGELSPKEVETVGEHLSACSECASKWHQLRSELEMFQSNHPDVEFTERLWAGVQARLELHAPTRKSSDGWLGKFFSAPRVTVPVTVGLVLSAVVATALVMNLLSEAPGARSVSQNANNVELAKRPESSPINELQPSLIEPAHKFAQSEEAKPLKRRAAKLSGGGVPSMDRKSPEQLVREAEKKYLSAIGILSRDIGRRQSQLDQETRTRFEHALASIDRTIGATRKAVREHPTDPIAVQYMLSAYARKVDLLREIARSGAF